MRAGYRDRMMRIMIYFQRILCAPTSKTVSNVEGNELCDDMVVFFFMVEVQNEVACGSFIGCDEVGEKETVRFGNVGVRVSKTLR